MRSRSTVWELLQAHHFLDAGVLRLIGRRVVGAHDGDAAAPAAAAAAAAATRQAAFRVAQPLGVEPEENTSLLK